MQFLRFIGMVCVVLSVMCASAAKPPESHDLLRHADDYVYGYYPNGYRIETGSGIAPSPQNRFAIQTPYYALEHVGQVGLSNAGTLFPGVSAEKAAKQIYAEISSQLNSEVPSFGVRIGDAEYTALRIVAKPEDLVIQRLGKYLAHIELRGFSLLSEDNNVAPFTVDARLHIYAWPDHARLVFEIRPESELAQVSVFSRELLTNRRNSMRIVDLDVRGQVRKERLGEVLIVRSADTLAAGAPLYAAVGLYPNNALVNLSSVCTVRAEGISPYTGPLEVQYDARAGWQQILLGPNADTWTMERVKVEIENPSNQSQTLHLAFSKRGGGFGITGMSPVLCDADGVPSGLPIQISKNWHVSPPWFDGITILEVPPNSKHRFEFRLAYAEWGGVPAVSHAQLALEGWGTHQLWDECAIGSFGESITYDPDVNLNRSMIDDVRPLMVWGMGQKPQQRWSWTHNVGGGDFLVLEQVGKRQYLARQKTDYDMQGPVLTCVRYSGETPDGAIQSHITTQSWRSDDFVRGLYTLRYDVLNDAAFSRLAFLQLGADHYNTNISTHISRGNLDGEKETWTPLMGGKKYSREGLPIEGGKPWFAITGNAKNPPPFIKEGDQGAWADRGMIVHSWKARLNGDEVPLPHYSIYGTEDGKVPSAIVELSPPAGLAQLKKGDFVETVVEMLILPQSADDYYGPNESLRAALKEHGGTWRMVHREAEGTALRVRAEDGDVVSQWPVIVRAHRGKRAAFTIEGGNGWVPVIITGAKSPGKPLLTITADGAAQSVSPSSGNDWWQTRWRSASESCEFIYTLDLRKQAKKRAVLWTAEQ